MYLGNYFLDCMSYVTEISYMPGEVTSLFGVLLNVPLLVSHVLRS